MGADLNNIGDQQQLSPQLQLLLQPQLLPLPQKNRMISRIMIQQQLPPPKPLELHIINTSCEMRDDRTPQFIICGIDGRCHCTRGVDTV